MAIVLPLNAARAETGDPIGDLIGQVAAKVAPFFETFGLKATLYHLGLQGIHDHDFLGCKSFPMRTAAVDGIKVKRHSLLFIKETVGLPMPNGRLHDGYWFATDIGGGIHPGLDRPVHRRRPLVDAALAAPEYLSHLDGRQGRRIHGLPHGLRFPLGFLQRTMAATFPPSTVITAPVVRFIRAANTKAWATSSAVTSSPSRLPVM